MYPVPSTNLTISLSGYLTYPCIIRFSSSNFLLPTRAWFLRFVVLGPHFCSHPMFDFFFILRLQKSDFSRSLSFQLNTLAKMFLLPSLLKFQVSMYFSQLSITNTKYIYITITITSQPRGKPTSSYC